MVEDSFYNLSKKQRKALKRQLEQEAKRVDARNRTLRRIAIIATVIVVIGLIGWVSINKGKQQAAIQATSSIGGEAPNFSLPATTEETITLSDFRSKKNVLLYFHEGLTCDPCMQQIPELEKALDEFEKLDIEVLAVSGVDSIGDLKQGLGRFGIKKIPLLSYTNANTEIDYDLTRFSMGMGRRAGHTFILVDKNRKIVWRKDYWPGRGHMVAGGTMFVNSSEIVGEVKRALNK